MQPGDFRIDDAVEFLVQIVIDFIGLRSDACLDHVLDQLGFKVIGDFLPSIICGKFISVIMNSNFIRVFKMIIFTGIRSYIS
jgi:hypothetical protein